MMQATELTSATDIPAPARVAGWKRDALLIFGLALASFTIGLPGEFIGLDARYALFAKEMLRNGPSFFPTTYALPYPDYPATTVLPIVWISKVTGSVTPLTAILPTAVVSSGILVFIYLIGALHSRKWGLCAVCMAFLTLSFLRAARSISPDQWISLATVASFYAVWSASVLGQHRRLCWVPLLFVFGFACRGLIGLIIPAAVVVMLLLCMRQFKAAISWTAVAGVLLAVGGWILQASAEHQGGEAFAQRVWEMEVYGRMIRGGRGPAYYWVSALGSYAFAYPIAVLAAVGLWRRITDRENAVSRLLFALVMCAAVVLAGMSVPAGKKARYVLSIVPFVALVAAYGLMWLESPAILARFRRAATCGCVALTTLVGLVCIGRTLLVRFGVIPGEIYLLRETVCIIVATLFAFGIGVRWARGSCQSVHVLAISAASLLILQIGVIEPSCWAREASLPFVREVETDCPQPTSDVVFFRLGPDQEDILLAANTSEQIRPRFTAAPGIVLSPRRSACIITDQEDLPDLLAAAPDRTTVVGRGFLGGKPVALCRTGETMR